MAEIKGQINSRLAENDQDLMAWVLGQSAPPTALIPLLSRITAFAETRLKARI